MRAELYHPLIVHFPLVLLGLSPVMLFMDSVQQKILRPETTLFCFRLFFYGGLGFFFLSLFLGDMALEEVSRFACDLPKIHQHEDYAHYALYVYLPILLYEPLASKYPRKWIGAGAMLFMLAGTFFLVRSAHSGAMLVYEHGTAVITATCE